MVSPESSPELPTLSSHSFSIFCQCPYQFLLPPILVQRTRVFPFETALPANELFFVINIDIDLSAAVHNFPFTPLFISLIKNFRGEAADLYFI